MSDSPPPRPEEERASWMGAPGYQPHQELPPHAPMPGAPPYPAGLDEPVPPVGGGPRTSYWMALAATAIGAVIQVVLLIAIAGPPPSARGRDSGKSACSSKYRAPRVLLPPNRAWCCASTASVSSRP